MRLSARAQREPQDDLALFKFGPHGAAWKARRLKRAFVVGASDPGRHRARLGHWRRSRCGCRCRHWRRCCNNHRWRCRRNHHGRWGRRGRRRRDGRLLRRRRRDLHLRRWNERRRRCLELGWWRHDDFWGEWRFFNFLDHLGFDRRTHHVDHLFRKPGQDGVYERRVKHNDEADADEVSSRI